MTSSWRVSGAEPAGLGTPAASFARFLAAGVLNAIATFAAYLALCRMLTPTQAYSIAYALGIGLSYLLNSALVFNVPVSAKRALRFPIVYAAQYLYGLLLIWLLTSPMHVSKELAMLLVITSSVPLTFLLTRRALR